MYSISQLYDLCCFNEWRAISDLNNYKELLKTAIELYIKEQLCKQRLSLTNYAFSLIDKPNKKQQEEFENIFRHNDIEPDKFFYCLNKVLRLEHEKKNCLRIWGLPNSCKSLISYCICEPFICAYLNNHCSENEFYLSNCLNKTIILCEELYITPSTCEDFKSILGGKMIDVSKKFNEKQILSRTPVIVTSNHERFGRGNLAPVDEEALQLRCYSFNFTAVYTPGEHLDACNFYYFMKKYV